MVRTFRVLRVLTLLGLVCILISVLLNRQALHDWWLLRSYTPPLAVVQLADQTTLTASGRRLFYVNHPAIDDRMTFNTSCSNRGEQTIVLGCYHPVDQGIFVFHVADPRLEGVDQVTAAHEMLHAAYDRLGQSERTSLDQQLNAFYKTNLHDDRIKRVIDSYKKTEPNDVVNEMHSIFATEVSDLPPGLEQYYQKYFINRKFVVRYANQYQSVFTSRQTQVASYDARLTGLKQKIDASTASLDQQEKLIIMLRTELDRTRGGNDIDTYNRLVPQYNTKIDAYNGLINAAKGMITQYNQIVADRNNIALQVTELAHAIDSKFQSL